MVIFQKIIIIFCISINLSKAYDPSHLEDTLTLWELPGGMIAEALSYVTEGEISNVFGCLTDLYDYDRNKINLWLFNRENAVKPIRLDLDNPQQMDLQKPLKILVHGWLGNSSDLRMIQLKDAYLETYDCNVIGVEWTAYSVTLYSNAVCYNPKIAETIGNFLCRVASSSNSTLDLVHVLGHSLGGQMAGLIGQEVQNQCQMKLGRITGLDPAGPLYTFAPEDRRLDSSDATFVDVIHTNNYFLGYPGSCGTVDFYPNCGASQLGCMYKSLTFDIINYPLRVVMCNHFRSVDYMLESIRSKRFVSTRGCLLCPEVCQEDLDSPRHVVMGEFTPVVKEHHEYYIPTHSISPFARGRIG